ncbi:hypothetical protein D3C76_789620 [compost metagenome]
MACDVAGNLATASGMADMHGVLQIQVRDQFRKIRGVGVHVVAFVGLRGATVAAAVMGNHAVALGEEEQHLIVPVVPRQRPAVVEHDGLPATPIFVEQLGAVTQCEVS